MFALPDISCPKERCLPSASNSPGPPERPLHLPQDVHLLIEAPSGPHPRCRHPCHCLLGRFMSLGGLSPRRSRFCREVSSILEELGFLSDIQNSTLAPTNSLSWLGIVRFSETGAVRVPETFAQGIAAMARDMLYRGQSSHRRFETLLGKIAFASQFSTEARLRSHEFANPQLIASRDRDRIQTLVPPQFSRALCPWVNPRFLISPLQCDCQLTP